jgi:3-oxoacyl-[acyl-carrier protein] reductase
VDVAIANAGIWKGARIERMTAEEWDETLEVNLGGTWRLCREAVPAIRRRGGGSIVVVSSTAGQRGESLHSHYAASKGAQISLVKSLAVECAPEIRVNGVAPGWVDTELSAGPLGGEERAAIVAAIPLGRVATAEDIADAIAFLASDRARHVTGEILNVNGGSVLCG